MTLVVFTGLAPLTVANACGPDALSLAVAEDWILVNVIMLFFSCTPHSSCQWIAGLLVTCYYIFQQVGSRSS